MSLFGRMVHLEVFRLMASDSLHKFLTVVGSLLLSVVVGSSTVGLATYSPYLISYVRAYLDPRITQLDGVFYLGMSLAVTAVTINLGELISNKLGPRITAVIGSLLVGAGIICTRWTLPVSFFVSILTLAFVTALGCSLQFPATAHAMTQWYSQEWVLNLVVGGGYGFGIYLAALVQTLLINAGNIYPDLDDELNEKYFGNATILTRIRDSPIFIGSIYTVLGVIGGLFLFQPSAEQEELTPLTGREKIEATSSESKKSTLSHETQTGDKSASQESQTDETDEALHRVTDIDPLTLLKCNKQFYILWLLFLCYSITYLFMISLFKTYGQTFTNSDHYFMWLSIAAAVGFIIGRLVYQKLTEKVPVKVLYMIIGSINIFDMCTQLFLPLFSPSVRSILYVFWVFSIFMQQSGTMTLLPIACSRSFGIKYFNYNQGLLFTALILPVIIAILPIKLASWLGWIGVYMVLAGFQLLGLMLAIIYDAKMPDGSDV